MTEEEQRELTPFLVSAIFHEELIIGRVIPVSSMAPVIPH